MSKQICGKCGAWKTVCNCIPKQSGMSSQEVISNRELAEANFMQAGPGGICFAHGPYAGYQCPQWRDAYLSPCIADPRKPEYLAMAQEQMRQTNKVYTQAELDAALNTREQETVERCAVIAEAVNDSTKNKGKLAAAILNPEICIVPLNADGKVGLQSEHVLDNEGQCVYCGEFRATVRDDEGGTT